MFSVIVLSHYFGWVSYADFSAGKDREETTWHRVGAEAYVPGRTELKVLPGTTFKDGYARSPTTQHIPVQIGAHMSIDPRRSMLPDVRMPFFVLGVFYVGLFAILGDDKRKEQ